MVITASYLLLNFPERPRNYLRIYPRLGQSRAQRAAGLDAQRERAAAAARAEEQHRAEAFVLDRLRALGRIRFGLLRDIGRDEGFDPRTTIAAVKALGCRVEKLPEFDNRKFVFLPAERVA